jgi:hypothetical protein
VEGSGGTWERGCQSGCQSMILLSASSMTHIRLPSTSFQNDIKEVFKYVGGETGVGNP